MTNLYELTAVQHALQAQLEAAGFDDQTIADTLEGEDNTEALKEKRLGYIAIIKSKLAFSEARARAANDMAELADAEIKQAHRMEDALLKSMQATGDKDIVGLQFEAHIRKNPPSVEVIDSLSLPAEYWRTPELKTPMPTPDKSAIKLALQAGKDVMGAKLVISSRLVIQ